MRKYQEAPAINRKCSISVDVMFKEKILILLSCVPLHNHQPYVRHVDDLTPTQVLYQNYDLFHKLRFI